MRGCLAPLVKGAQSLEIQLKQRIAVQHEHGLS
jgi:hypothetical protein